MPYLHLFQELVEHCSYKGLTPSNAYSPLTSSFIEYCSYKGLTPFAFPYFKSSVIG